MWNLEQQSRRTYLQSKGRVLFFIMLKQLKIYMFRGQMEPQLSAHSLHSSLLLLLTILAHFGDSKFPGHSLPSLREGHSR